VGFGFLFNDIFSLIGVIGCSLMLLEAVFGAPFLLLAARWWLENKANHLML
jgi:hypothetical protein